MENGEENCNAENGSDIQGMMSAISQHGSDIAEIKVRS